MKAGSMEALVGASENIRMANTPMRIYKEAERRGDTATMERAIGYVAEFEQKATDYSQKAQEETAKEIKEERKEQELRREKAAEKRREDAKAFEEKIQEKANSNAEIVDGVEISEDGIEIVEQLEQSGEKISRVSNLDIKMYDAEGKSVTSLPKSSVSYHAE